MFSRWRPTGPGGIDVIKADHRNPALILGQVRRILTR
jgi:hypothetical protein